MAPLSPCDRFLSCHACFTFARRTSDKSSTARQVSCHILSCRSFVHSAKVSKFADLKTKADFLEERVNSRALRLIGTCLPDSCARVDVLFLNAFGLSGLFV